MAEQWLAIVDADRIHDYVFSPRELRLVKGGSFLQSRLNTEVLPQAIQNGRCISKNGGTVVARFFGEGQARDFCRTAERQFRLRTSVATVSTAVVAHRSERWAEAKQELDDRLELSKHSRAKRQFAGSSPVWMVCQACGLFPAAHEYHTPSNRRWICHACQIRKEWSKDPPEWLSGLPSPDTFEEIGASAHPESSSSGPYACWFWRGRRLGAGWRRRWQ